MNTDKDFKVGALEIYIVLHGLSNFPHNEGKVSNEMMKDMYIKERKYNRTLTKPQSRWACYVITSDKVQSIMQQTGWYPNSKQLSKAYHNSAYYWIYWLPSKILNKLFLALHK